MTIHAQIPCLDFGCDEDLAELLTLMNQAGIITIMSCQDSNAGIGNVRRAWVSIHDWSLADFLAILNDPSELEDMDSLSNRMATEFGPATGWEEFRSNRAWHYSKCVSRIDGEIYSDDVDIRFPFTDLPEVVRRLREARPA